MLPPLSGTPYRDHSPSHKHWVHMPMACRDSIESQLGVPTAPLSSDPGSLGHQLTSPSPKPHRPDICFWENGSSNLSLQRSQKSSGKQQVWSLRTRPDSLWPGPNSSHAGCGHGPHQALKPPSQQGQQRATPPRRARRPRPGPKSKTGPRWTPVGPRSRMSTPMRGGMLSLHLRGCRSLGVTNSSEGQPAKKASREHPGGCCGWGRGWDPPHPSCGEGARTVLSEDSPPMLGLHCLGLLGRRVSPGGEYLFWAPPRPGHTPSPSALQTPRPTHLPFAFLLSL